MPDEQHGAGDFVAGDGFLQDGVEGRVQGRGLLRRGAGGTRQEDADQSGRQDEKPARLPPASFFISEHRCLSVHSLLSRAWLSRIGACAIYSRGMQASTSEAPV